MGQKAGALAASQTGSRTERDEAATKIQAAFEGHAVRAKKDHLQHESDQSSFSQDATGKWVRAGGKQIASC